MLLQTTLSAFCCGNELASRSKFQKKSKALVLFDSIQILIFIIKYGYS